MNKFLTFDFELKAVDEKDGTFEGYASTFNNIDLGGDMVMPGAFKKTIRESKGKIPILADHDPRKQIGWGLEASEDDKGLKVKGELLVHDVALAKERHALMKRALELKASSGISIGYAATRWEMDEDKQTNTRYRKLREIKLFEYSMVTFPMNTEAMATAAKNFEVWLKSLEGGTESQAVNKFVAQMIEEGFNELSIKSALETAAAKLKTPDPDVDHLLEQGFSDLKSIFAPKEA